MAQLKLCAEKQQLPLLHSFTIARGTVNTATTVVARLRWNELEGFGEGAPLERYGESVESVLSFLATHRLPVDDPYLLDELSLTTNIPPATRCALDIALHDLIGKDCGLPLFRFLGLDPAKTPVSSFTIGIADAATTLRKVQEIGEHPILKIKLGAGTPDDEIETIEAIRGVYRGTIRIDANEGWEPDEAVRVLREIARFDIEFCEQPVRAGRPEQLRYVRDRSSIPIVSDEDSLCAEDLPRLRGCVDGVNVKLAKAGGIRAAVRMIHVARVFGMKIMLGCMIESQISATAAAHISPLVDWADIDAPFLTTGDSRRGISYNAGKIVLPDGPGLGLTPVA